MADQFMDNAAIRKIERAMDLMASRYVVVGIPNEPSTNAKGELIQSPPSRDDDAPVNNAEIGYINHMGSGKIPPRPWLLPVVKENKAKVSAYFVNAIRSALNNPDRAIEIEEKAFNAAGLFIVGKVQERIRNKIPPPLAAATIALRKEKNSRSKNKKVQEAGGEEFTPLIDTGNFANNISYAIRSA